MNNNRFTRKLFNKLNSKKVKIKWLDETKEDLPQLNITVSIISNNVAFGALVAKHRFAERNKNKIS